MDAFLKKRTSKKANILAPSKSTTYISNLPFAFTNSDLYKIFGKYGKVVKVTIMKDRISRKSKGVAFILFGDTESALNCVKAVDGHEMFGRTLKANIAKDNGRASEFIRRREYPDKSRCYECGESFHLSYKCPKNLLGEREPPPKKKRIRIKESQKPPPCENEDSDESENDFEDESLSAAIRYQQELRQGEEFLQSPFNSKTTKQESSKSPKRKLKQSTYFSDEEEISD